MLHCLGHDSRATKGGGNVKARDWVSKRRYLLYWAAAVASLALAGTANWPKH